MSSTPGIGTAFYNWQRRQIQKQLALTSGLQLAAKVQSAPNKICGRQLDSSVNVNGVGGIAIIPDSITPDSIQGNAFAAPTFVGPNNHGNLLLNPTALQGLAAWTGFNYGTGIATFAYDAAGFQIDYGGGSSVDALLEQTVNGLTPGASIVLSGLLAIDHVTSSNTFAGTDILRLDSSNNALQVGMDGGVITQDYAHTAVQAATSFSLAFIVPSSGNLQIRLHVRNTGTTDGIGAHYSQLKLEYGTTPTAFNLTSFTAATQVDITGMLQSIFVSVGFTNIPLNAVKVLWLFKNTNSTIWTPWAETTIPGIPYPPSKQTLNFAYGQMSFGINYDFGAAYVDLQGNIGGIGSFSVAYNPNSSLYKVSSSYMTKFAVGYVPAFTSASVQAQPSPNGIATSISVSVTISNQPLDGSLSRVSFYYRVSGSIPWSFYGSVPALGVGLALSALNSIGPYQFTYTDLTLGDTVSYDFGFACEDTSGGETNVIQCQTSAAGPITLPNTSLAKAPINTYIEVYNQTTIATGTNATATWYTQISFNFATLDGQNGPVIDHTAWLSQINVLSKPIGSTIASDIDRDASHYVVVNTLHGNDFGNFISLLIGPFPTGINQEFALQLIDQAGGASPSLPFEIQSPPGPTYDPVTGHISYESLGTAITGVITPDGKLVDGIVTRGTIPENSNLLFNPTGARDLAGWTPLFVLASTYFGRDAFNGGRFRLYYAGGAPMDSVLYQSFLTSTNTQLLSNAQMVLSGFIEIDTITGSGSYAGVDIVSLDNAGNGLGVPASYYLTVTQGRTYFKLAFASPASGQLQVRMHIYNAGGIGTVDAYFYNLKLEYGNTPTTYNDDRSTGIVTNTHSPAGQVIVQAATVDGGHIDYLVQPNSTLAVINDTTKSYNASQATPPGNASIPPGISVQAPYYASSAAVQLGVGPNGEIYNGQFLSRGVTIDTSNVTITQHYNLTIPTVGTWLFFVTAQLNQNCTGASFSVSPTPGGYSSAANIGNTANASNGACSITGSFIANGGQTVTVNLNVGYTRTSVPGAAFVEGIFTLQVFRVSN